MYPPEIPEHLMMTGPVSEERVVTIALSSSITMPNDVTEVRILLNGSRISTLKFNRIARVFNGS